MTDCDIDPDSLRCRVCGAKVSGPNVRRNCRRGLGDMVAGALEAVGITHDRAAAVAAAAGWRDCGCSERREWLNRVGRAFGIG